MNLGRIIFKVNGVHLTQAKKAARNLPEGVLKGQTSISLHREEEPLGKDKREVFVLKPQGSLYAVELPEGLHNIFIYRRNDSPRENGEVRFDCGNYHYRIPPLED